MEIGLDSVWLLRTTKELDDDDQPKSLTSMTMELFDDNGWPIFSNRDT